MPSPHSSSNVRTRKEKAAARYCNGDGANGQQEKSSEPQWVYFFSELVFLFLQHD